MLSVRSNVEVPRTGDILRRATRCTSGNGKIGKGECACAPIVFTDRFSTYSDIRVSMLKHRSSANDGECLIRGELKKVYNI